MLADGEGRETPTGPLAELDEGQPASLVCRASGSRPAARLEWTWPPSSGPEFKATTGSEVSLELVGGASWRHHGARLTCSATNEHFAAALHRDRSVSRQLELSVKCKLCPLWPARLVLR